MVRGSIVVVVTGVVKSSSSSYGSAVVVVVVVVVVRLRFFLRSERRGGGAVTLGRPVVPLPWPTLATVVLSWPELPEPPPGSAMTNATSDKASSRITSGAKRRIVPVDKIDF